MEPGSESEANAGRDAGWSRRRALQSAGAALVTVVGIVDTLRTPSRKAQQGLQPFPPRPQSRRLQGRSPSAEVQNWPYVLSNLKNLTKERPEAHDCALSSMGRQSPVCKG